jgi:hypothetical protein
VFGLHHATIFRHLVKHPLERKPCQFPDYSGEWAI